MDTTTNLDAPVNGPLIVNVPKYITADGLAIPMRPVPPTTISYTHTDSSYSRMSQRSDFSPRLEENVEGEAETASESPEVDKTTVEPATVPPERAAPEAVPTIITTPDRPPPLHVLVIDDDPLTRTLMTRVRVTYLGF